MSLRKSKYLCFPFIFKDTFSSLRYCGEFLLLMAVIKRTIKNGFQGKSTCLNVWEVGGHQCFSVTLAVQSHSHQFLRTPEMCWDEGGIATRSGSNWDAA